MTNGEAIQVIRAEIEPLSWKQAEALDMAIEALSADRPSGEWLEIEDYNGDYHYQCSACKDEFYIEYGTPKENGYTYCPSCGARMGNTK